MREVLLRVAHKNPKRLIVDLSDVSYMDSSGVGTMVEIKPGRTGRRPLVLGSPARVRSVFEVTQLDRFLTLPRISTTLRTCERQPESAGSAFWFRGPATSAAARARGSRGARRFVYVGGITRLLGTVIQRTWYAVRGRGTRIHASSLTAQMARRRPRHSADHPGANLHRHHPGAEHGANVTGIRPNPAYSRHHRDRHFPRTGAAITAVLLSGFAAHLSPPSSSHGGGRGD